MNKSLVKVPKKHIENLILIIRGEKVILDSELVRKVNALEQTYDTQFKVVFEAIRQLMNPTPRKVKHIGFRFKI